MIIIPDVMAIADRMAVFSPFVNPVLGNVGVVLPLPPVGAVQVVGIVIVLWSRVTAAVWARTRPCSEAPVIRLRDE